jgi:isopenicillin-N epimerase
MQLDADLHHPATDSSVWALDPEIILLNHGSFGSCPRAVLAWQQSLRDHLEWQPVQFLVRELEGLLDRARLALSQFVGADADDLVFVPNATAGVNTVLRSLRFNSGDELLVTNQEYNACRNALEAAGQRERVQVGVVDVPFPLEREEQILSAVLERVTARTRLVLLDHVTSQTGVIWPIARFARELASRGIDLLIDGAHAPGMLPLNLRELGVPFYTGNCHKWMCAPKGAGFLFVERRRQSEIRPLSISHGANSPRQDRSRFQIEFGWTGTWDPSAVLSIPEALRFVQTLLPGGWPAIMDRNRRLALEARRILAKALRIPLPCPNGLIGSMASLPMPDSPDSNMPASPLYSDPVQDRLREQFGIEVPIIPWPASPKRLLRISAQLYNSIPQYERLAQALGKIQSASVASSGASSRS